MDRFYHVLLFTVMMTVMLALGGYLPGDVPVSPAADPAIQDMETTGNLG